MILLGYGVAYWQFHYAPGSFPDRYSGERDVLLSQMVLLERQLQIERAMQAGAAKEMTALQMEGMQLKEEVQFYKSILAEGGDSGVIRFHSIKLEKSALPNQYQYHVVLVQSGRHDKWVEGDLQLSLVGGAPASYVRKLPIKFKYYQRVDGVLATPPDWQGERLMLTLTDARGKGFKLTQSVNLP